jgi:hypothetical protein
MSASSVLTAAAASLDAASSALTAASQGLTLVHFSALPELFQAQSTP